MRKRKRLRPSLSFMTKLPTLEVKESFEKGITWWKVNPGRFVIIHYPPTNTHFVLDYFWVMVIPADSIRPVRIGITVYKKLNGAFIIPPQEEKYFLNNTWWENAKPKFTK